MFRPIILSFLLCICCTTTSLAAKIAPIPRTGLLIALADARANPIRASESWYLFTRYPSVQDYGGVNFGLNLLVSTNSTAQIMCVPVDPEGLVYRVDLRLLNPQDADYERVFLLIESLAHSNRDFHSIDPEFHINADGVSVDRDIADLHGINVRVPPFKFKGQTFQNRILARFVPALHLADEKGTLLEYLELQELMGKVDFKTGIRVPRKNPIMGLDQFISIVMRSAKDGLYYEFAGIPDNVDDFHKLVKYTPEDKERVTSEQRSVMFRRTLNEMPSKFEWSPTQGTKLTYGPGYIIRTQDYAKRQVEARNHPITNLLKDTHLAEEVFASKPNGLPFFFLYNEADGTRQDVAPPDIALDDSYGKPREIEAPHGCIHCHGPQEGTIKSPIAMFHPLQNHVIAMLETPVPIEGWDRLSMKKRALGLGILVQEEDTKKQSFQDLLAIALELYEGKPKDMLWQARLMTAKATHDATGGVFGLNPVVKASKALTNQLIRYEFEPVSPKKACLELGIDVETDKESQILLGKIAKAMYPNTYGFSGESPVLWALIVWDPTDSNKSRMLPSRQDWENEYPVIMSRLYEGLKSGVIKL